MIGSARDVAIVGTSAIGAGIAHTLGWEGLQVAVLAPQPRGSGCSFHGMALVWKPV
ncbi:MAG TPA: hypothetical protein VNP04_25235 [Alphaproteobacteria bacterium]|nr:hypothetical protein [Alphaproteobacteria bacterium]